MTDRNHDHEPTLDEQHDGWGAPCDPDPDAIVAILCGGWKQNVMAYVFGAWAVHRAVGVHGIEPRPDPNSWAVSHRPSGCSIGIALELDFWDAIRIARALEDSGIVAASKNTTIEGDDVWIFQAAVGAALNDQYVWPFARSAP